MAGGMRSFHTRDYGRSRYGRRWSQCAYSTAMAGWDTSASIWLLLSLLTMVVAIANVHIFGDI